MRNRTKSNQLQASLPMAIMDALPVLCFSLSMLLLAQQYRSVLFIAGSICCILAGAGKVIWKLLLATLHRDVRLFYRQFRYLMPLGFGLMLLSLFVNRPSLSVIWKNISGFPCWILFLAGVAGFVSMGILAAKMDADSAKANWIEQSVNLIAQLCILFAIAIIWYGADYYAADLSEVQNTATSGSVQIIEVDTGLFLDGSGTDTALIFYPGAKVEYTAYLPMLLQLAEHGVDCFLVEMPYNMAIFGLNTADTLQGTYSYSSWYIGGHSLGGAMAAYYAADHLEDLEGVILLAAYASKSLGELPVLSIYGSEDGVLNLSKVEAGRQYAENYTEICIPGGNHAWFGSYGEQAGDGTAVIDHEAQWQQTVESILDWMDAGI